MSVSFLTQGYHVVYMCPNAIFQILLLHSRPMTSHHVTCHVTAVSCASSLSKSKIKETRKENQYKIRKIKELLILKHLITINSFYYTRYLSTPFIFLLFSIFSTSYSLTSSTLIGFPSSFFYSPTCFLYCTIQLTFTTR